MQGLHTLKIPLIVEFGKGPAGGMEPGGGRQDPRFGSAPTRRRHVA